MPHKDRLLWFGLRQALIIALGHVEDYLGVERSIVPQHKRREWRARERHESTEHDSNG